MLVPALLLIASCLETPAEIASGGAVGGDAPLDRYAGLMRAGATANSVSDYGGAEAAYRPALDVCADAFGPDDAVCAEPAGRLALEISNQGRFEESGPLLDYAERLLAAEGGAREAPLWRSQVRANAACSSGDTSVRSGRCAAVGSRRRTGGVGRVIGSGDWVRSGGGGRAACGAPVRDGC